MIIKQQLVMKYVVNVTILRGLRFQSTRSLRARSIRDGLRLYNIYVVNIPKHISQFQCDRCKKKNKKIKHFISRLLMIDQVRLTIVSMVTQQRFLYFYLKFFELCAFKRRTTQSTSLTCTLNN